MNRIVKLMSLAMAVVVSGVAAQAAIKTDTTTMNQSADWNPNGELGISDTGTFDNTISAINANTLTLGGSISIAALVFNNNLLGPVTIASGNTLTLNSSGTGLDLSAANTNVTINCSTALGASQTWNVNSGRTLTLGGVVSGTGMALTKAGAGTLTLAATNSYSGATTISSGTLKLGLGVGNGAVIHYDFNSGNVSGSTLANLGTGGSAYNGVIGSGVTFVSGMGGDAALFPGTSINSRILTASSLALGTSFTFSTWVSQVAYTNKYQRIINNAYANGGYLGTDPSSPNKYTIITKNTFLVSSQAIDTSSNWHLLTYVANGGTQTLYYDGASITSGVAAAGAYTQLIAFGNNYTTTLEGFKGLMDEAYVFDRGLSAAEVRSLYTNPYGSSLPGNTSLSIASGSTLDLNGNSQTVASLSDSGAGGGAVTNSASATPLTLTVNPSSGSTAFSGTISDSGPANAISLVMSGSGTWTLAGTNNYSGGTTISAGTVAVSNNAALGTGYVRMNGGSLTNAGGAWTLANVFNLSSNATVGVGDTDALTLSGLVTNTGALTKVGAGTLTLAGTNSYSGATTISSGTLKLGLGVGNGAVIHYDFNSGNVSGNTLANLGTGGSAYNGVIGSGVTFVSGMGGDAALFPGTSINSRILTASSLALGTSFTFSTWVSQVTAVGARYQRIINNSYPSGGYLGTDDSNPNKYEIITKNTALVSSTTIDTSSTWHLLTYVANGGTQTLYYDGASITSGVAAAAAYTQLIAFGNNYTSTDEGFKGLMDEAYVFDRGLSAAEVRSLYTNPYGSSLPGNTSLSIASGSTLDLNGNSQTVASLSDSGAGGGAVTNSASVTPLTLTVNPSSGSTAFSGTISDSGSANAISLVMGGAGTWTLAGTNNYSGGTTISAGALAVSNNAALGTGYVRMNGGSLTNAGGAWTLANVFNLSSNATVGVGDTDALTLSGAITNSRALVKVGNGTLTLSGSNTYTGATTVNAGELVGVTGGSCSNSAVTVAAGATNGVQIAIADGKWFCQGLTNASGGTLVFNFIAPASTNLANAPLQVLGDGQLSLASVNVVVQGPLSSGTIYPLIQYSGTIPALSLASLSLPPGVLGVVSNDTAHGLIELVLTNGPLGTVYWAAGNGNWDIAATMNWKTNSSAGVANAVYLDGEPVVFDNSASGTSPILVTNTATVSPGSVTVNADTNYIISGSPITGIATLTKAGSGTLTLSGANTYSGGTTNSAGTLAVSNTTALGSGPVVMTNSLLRLAASITVGNLSAVDGSAIIDLGAAGTSLTVNEGGATTFAGSLTNAGGLAKASGGTLTLSGVNTYTGATTVNAGGLVGATGGSCSNSQFTVANGATNGVQVITSGGTWFCQGLTNNAGGAMDFNFIAPATTSAAPIQVLGNLDVSGVNFIVRGAVSGISGSQYPLIKYTGAPPVSVPTSVSLPAGMTGSISNNTANSSIDLVLTSTSTAYWAVGSGNWNVSEMNWKATAASGVTNAFYLEGEPVVLDDSASGVTSILVTNTATVSPASVTVSNVNKAYTISGSPISGSTSLTKLGANTLTLTGTNIYSGYTYPGLGALIVNGGMISNTLNIGISAGADDSLVLTNGGKVFTQYKSGTGNGIGWGPDNKLNRLLIYSNSLFNGGGSFLTIGTALAYSNGVTVADGGVLTNVTSVELLGSYEAVVITNGGQVFSRGNSSIGKSGGASNTVWMGSSSTSATSRWDLGAATVSIGSGIGNSLTVSSGGILTNGSVAFGGGSVLTLGGDAYVANVNVTVSDAQLNFNGGTLHATASGNLFSGLVWTNTTAASLDTAGFTVTNAIGIAGTGSLTKLGGGKLVLAANHTYTGATTNNAGTLLVEGSISNSACTVNSGATVGGTGTVGSVTVSSGATNAPGHNGVGTLTASGSVVLKSGSTLAMQIDSDAGTSNKLAAASVTIEGGAALSVTNLGTTYLGGGKAYTLVSRSSGNDEEAFSGYPEGHMFLLGQNYFRITYKGGTSLHDVVITNERYEGTVFTIR